MTTPRRRIGIFGGTFDPVHLGHLILAEQCREQGRLEQVWFIPAASPPHKQGKPITRFEQRVEMLELALAGNPAFRIDPIEQSLSFPSYTADTLVALRPRHPDCDFFLLIGSDSMSELPGWYKPRQIVENSGLLVMLRAKHPMKSVEEMRAALGLETDFPLKIEHIQEPPIIDISSRDMRQRVAQGRTVRYLIPRAVEAYIADKHLYRS